MKFKQVGRQIGLVWVVGTALWLGIGTVSELLAVAAPDQAQLVVHYGHCPKFQICPLSTQAVGTQPAQALQTEGCTNLQESLVELMQTTNPLLYAANHSLYLVDGWVRVLIELKSADAVLPQGYLLLAESRNGNFVQTLAPVAVLCALSNEPQVAYVRVPLELDPNKTLSFGQEGEAELVP